MHQGNITFKATVLCMTRQEVSPLKSRNSAYEENFYSTNSVNDINPFRKQPVQRVPKTTDHGISETICPCILSRKPDIRRHTQLSRRSMVS